MVSSIQSRPVWEEAQSPMAHPFSACGSRPAQKPLLVASVRLMLSRVSPFRDERSAFGHLLTFLRRETVLVVSVAVCCIKQ